MNKPRYLPLSREQIHQLKAPENAEAEQVWTRLRGALHNVVAMFSSTHPRPLYWNAEFNRTRLEQDPNCLRGTAFYEPALRNVRAAEHIERLFREHGDTAELHETVDAYLDELLDEFDEMRLYPELPPANHAENGLADAHRAISGR